MKNEFMIIGFSEEFKSKKGAKMRSVTVQQDKKGYMGIYAYTVYVNADSIVGELVEGALCELYYNRNSDFVAVLRVK